MRKAVFKNQIYYFSLIVILIVLLVINIIQLFENKWKMLIPIIVQIVLLILIFSKHHYSRIAIKIWLIILLLTGGIQLITGVFYLLAGETNLSSLLIRVLFVIIDILLLVNLKSIIISNEEQL